MKLIRHRHTGKVYAELEPSANLLAWKGKNLEEDVYYQPINLKTGRPWQAARWGKRANFEDI